jgi:hypothetical protein
LQCQECFISTMQSVPMHRSQDKFLVIPIHVIGPAYLLLCSNLRAFCFGLHPTGPVIVYCISRVENERLKSNFQHVVYTIFFRRPQKKNANIRHPFKLQILFDRAADKTYIGGHGYMYSRPQKNRAYPCKGIITCHKLVNLACNYFGQFGIGGLFH